ncbi:MAG: DUF3768 domain-containing protein [Alphaproteobacteria bacterium]|nr:DUF3768 domain-containing protein [Alphaproteobacteria bacterium]
MPFVTWTTSGARAASFGRSTTTYLTWKHGSENRADQQQTVRVLTIMLVDELTSRVAPPEQSARGFFAPLPPHVNRPQGPGHAAVFV